MSSIIKVDNIQNQPGTNIVNKCGTTITLGASGDTVSLASGASQSGFGRTGTVDWQTGDIKTGDFTAVSGKGYFVNTTSGGVTATLPSSPSAGDIVGLKDYALTFDDNALTIGRGGSPINGGSSLDPTVTSEGATVMLVYVDGTKGWIPTQDDTSALSGTSQFPVVTVSGSGNTLTTVCSDYKVAKFTGPGTFTVCSAGSVAANNVVSYLVVGGGGGGGATQGSWGGGGGGAGGFRELKSPTGGSYSASPLDGYPTSPNRITIAAGGYPIAVGGGGPGGTSCPQSGPSGPGSPAAYGCGGQGVNSSFSTITAAGGGYGGGGRPAPSGSRTNPGGPGGSGGGVASPYSGGGATPTGSGGTGNTPPVTPPQGNNAGTADGHGTTPSPAHRRAASGGGGATAASSNATSGGTAGGAGATTVISGTPTIYGGGGGGGSESACSGSPAGGPGGGGAGGNPPSCAAVAGTANTGGGGGGGAYRNESGQYERPGKSGGTGIVMVAYSV